MCVHIHIYIYICICTYLHISDVVAELKQKLIGLPDGRSPVRTPISTQFAKAIYRHFTMNICVQDNFTIEQGRNYYGMAELRNSITMLHLKIDFNNIFTMDKTNFIYICTV